MGTPSVFVRIFGCNFTCSGYGMSGGELSKERLNVDPTKYSNYKDLPLVHTGCDSYASWDPRFKHLSKDYTIPELVDEITKLIPGGEFSENIHLILTGGEPLLKGNQPKIVSLLKEINSRKLNLKNITFETNGTQKLLPELKTHIQDYKTTFSVSSKLRSSGESITASIKPDVILEYYETIKNFYGNMYFKWVISNEDDLVNIKEAISLYNLDTWKEYFDKDIPIYLMPAGGTIESYNKNEKVVADIALKNGYRFSPRLQIPLYKNAWGT